MAAKRNGMSYKDAGLLGYHASKDTIDRNKQIREEKYYNNPKYCKYCNKIIPYDKRNTFFCNNLFVNTYNNNSDNGVINNFNKGNSGKQREESDVRRSIYGNKRHNNTVCGSGEHKKQSLNCGHILKICVIHFAENQRNHKAEKIKFVIPWPVIM